MNRAEHLAWCKARALEYVDAGDLPQAFASMGSDVMKHEETRHHDTTNTIGAAMLFAGQLNTPEKMRAWINGYN